MLNWIKWTATATLIAGTAVNSAGFYPQGPLLLILGGFIWLWAALIMRDRALIVTNLVMSMTGLLGLLYFYNT
jgi:hypothetical protein